MYCTECKQPSEEFSYCDTCIERGLVPCDICMLKVGITHFDNGDGTVSCTPCVLKYGEPSLVEAITYMHSCGNSQYYYGDPI